MATEQELLAEASSRMQKSIESLARDLNTVRTGRASPVLVESLIVDYYGAPTPLNQLASISVAEARTLTITPWDKQALQEVEKSILKSDLGLVPNNDGTVIRINIPALTEERRRELVRVVSSKIEDGHVAVRNIRRDGISGIRQLEKNNEISKDDSRRSQDNLQQITDNFVAQMDDIGQAKETEVMEV
jgi:ribosome recycling factor